MDAARKKVKEEVNNWDKDDNQDQEPGLLEKNDDGPVWVKEEVLKLDWDCANHQDQHSEPGECEENDGPMDVKIKEEVDNWDANQDQPPGPSVQQNDDGPVGIKPKDYYKELLRQKEALDPQQFPDVIKHIERELLRSCPSKSSEEKSNDVHTSLDLFNDPVIRMTVKCFLPRKYFGKFKDVARLLGPRGADFRALKDETGTEMALRGKGSISINNPKKEQLLRDGGYPQYSHLGEETHVAITVSAPASEVYTKLGYATTCLKRHILRRDGDGLTPWIVRGLQNGKGPCRYYKSHTSNDEYPRNTHDPTLPLHEVYKNKNEAPGRSRSHYHYSRTGVNLTEQCGAFGIPINTLLQVFGSAGSDYCLPSKAIPEYRSAKSVRYHPYQKK